MGGNTSDLRKAMLKNDVTAVKECLDEAGDGAADLINEDYTSDCLFTCQRNIQTPLHSAVQLDKYQIVQVFYEYGADPHLTTKFGHTGIHLAAKRNSVEMCKLHLRFGAELYARDIRGKYAVHMAAVTRVMTTSQDVTAALQFLIKEVGKEEDVNLTDQDGNTPLHEAAFYDNLPTAEYLVTCGADVNACNKAGQTALQVATGKGREDVMKMLHKHANQS